MSTRLLASAAFAAALASSSASTAQPVRLLDTPTQCREYGVRFHSPAADWNQLLSYAACIQDRTIEDVRDADQLPAMVERMGARLELSLILYASAIQDGPRDVQMRAAFHIGRAAVGLLERARASVPVALHAQLDPLLASTRDVARTAFTLVLRFAREDPALIRDDVTTYIADASERYLHELGSEWEPYGAPIRVSGVK